MTAVESNRFFEFLDKARASLDDPDEQLVHQTFEVPRRRIGEIDDLVQCGALDSVVAEDRRLIMQRTAWSIACKRVLNSWNTKDKLNELFARYHSTVSGQALHHPTDKEDIRRTEVVKQFEDVGRVLQLLSLEDKRTHPDFLEPVCRHFLPFGQE